MQSRFAIPVVLLSVVGAIAFAVLWKAEQQRTYSLTIATGGKDGEYYRFAVTLADVVERHHPHIQIEVQESEGSQQNMERVANQTVDLALVQNDTPVQPDVRAIAYLFPEVFHLVVRSTANIQTVDDLRGKRIALMPRGSGSYALFWVLARHYDLAETDFQPLPMSPTEAYDALRQGQVDGLFRVIAMGSTSIRELLQTTQAALVPIDQDDSLRLLFPYLETHSIPKGTYSGSPAIPADDIPVVGVRAVLVTHTAVDSRVVKDITKTLFEFRNELVSAYPRAAMIRLPEAGTNLGLPLHPGARAYYEQDQPSFWVEYAEPIGLLFSVSVLLASGFWQFRLWLLERQKNRADMYNLKILEMIDRVQKTQSFQELDAIREELFEIFNRVVVDLDNDKISPQSFQSFTFPWEVAINTIRHHERVLRSDPHYQSTLDAREAGQEPPFSPFD
jgi:uncharacterized protein